MPMKTYGYSYFCGANTLIKVNDFPVTEAVGISYNLMDSTIPIYGYSSRLFDAVAPGQMIVQGSLVVNFVHHNYLYECIAWGSAGVKTNEVANKLENAGWNPESPAERAAIMDYVGTGEPIPEEIMYQYEKQWEVAPTLKPDTPYEMMRRKSPFGFSPINISISFSKRYTIDLLSVFFIGRGSTIQIDENVILEEYNFFARELNTRYYKETR